MQAHASAECRTIGAWLFITVVFTACVLFIAWFLLLFHIPHSSQMSDRLALLQQLGFGSVQLPFSLGDRAPHSLRSVVGCPALLQDDRDLTGEPRPGLLVAVLLCPILPGELAIQLWHLQTQCDELSGAQHSTISLLQLGKGSP